ncbi:hypothetical protein BC829DRAFT_450253 [Chytridium lagenaria]|nr:hypothetical protein BC829DRAFT_450253 [Chytridium lagenaria]
MDKNGEVQRQQLQNTYDDDYDGSGSPEEPTYSDDDDEPTQIEEMMEVDALNEDSNRSQRLSRRYVRMVDRSTAARGDTSNENNSLPAASPPPPLPVPLPLPIEGAYKIRSGQVIQDVSVKQSNNRRNAFPNVNCPAQTRSMTNSFFRRHWEHLVQTADNMSRKINAGILLLATYPGAMAAKAYTSPGFQQHVPASLLSFKNILDEFDKKLTDIAEKLDSSFESGSGIRPRVRIAPVEHQTIPDNSRTSSVCQCHYLAFRKTHRRLADPNALENQQAFLPKTKKDSKYF